MHRYSLMSDASRVFQRTNLFSQLRKSSKKIKFIIKKREKIQHFFSHLKYTKESQGSAIAKKIRCLGPFVAKWLQLGQIT